MLHIQLGHELHLYIIYFVILTFPPCIHRSPAPPKKKRNEKRIVRAKGAGVDSISTYLISYPTTKTHPKTWFTNSCFKIIGCLFDYIWWASFCFRTSSVKSCTSIVPCSRIVSCLVSHNLPLFPIASISSSCFCCCSYKKDIPFGTIIIRLTTFQQRVIKK